MATISGLCRVGATRHERTDERAGYRNGYRPRTLYTRVGPVTLLVPQTRDGSFSTDTRHRAEVAAAVKLVLQAPDLVEAKRRLAEFTERFAKSAPKAVACLEAGFEDAMAVMVLPEKYRKRLRTTNMQERLNEEIRRRERVIRIFPNDESALRLIGALLAEQNEAWQERKYLDMDEFKEWAASRAAASEGNNVVALAS
ncbi:MAG: transposase [Dechloromonas sp.]|nr:transposase [Candidatus Dechloromonas phosphoritropha]